MKYVRFLDIFKYLQLNIPLLDALEKMLTYVKFMKLILTKKQKYTDEDTIHLETSCNAIIQRTLSQKKLTQKE